MNKKVSVIVPVYNAERTLAACLGNLVHQTLSDIELILVNDHSTDQSLSILSECEQQFPDKILLIDLPENLGPGGARNVGLSYASGEYIGFVDSDDIADPRMYEILYETARREDCDMVDAAYYNETTDTLMLQTPEDCVGILDDHKRAKLISGGGYLWSRITRRELFEDLRFREHTILEDMETLMLLFLRTRKLGVTQEFLYKYSASPTSASQLSDPLRYHRAITDALSALAQQILPYCQNLELQQAVEYSLIHLYQCGIVNALHPDNHLDNFVQTTYLKDLKQLRNTFVHLPLTDNPFIQQKISAEDLDLIQRIDQ